MTQQHPITPPPTELVQQWVDTYFGGKISQSNFHVDLATRAAQWGADQELEACCEWLVSEGWFKYEHEAVEDLRTARRPKPPSLKEEALSALENLNSECLLEGFECPEKVATIRRALEQLPDSE
jgi:hypothetical protein